MIVFSMIVRARDGMALSASTDFNGDVSRSLKDSKTYIKMMAKKATMLPERCLLRLNSYTIYLVTSLGVSYIALCETSYPTVLAFSFLDEINREFVSLYNTTSVSEVRRPYAFIEFDNCIHKTRQRYNNPRSLTTRVNLSELSNDIKIRPPHVLKLEDVEPFYLSYNGASRAPPPPVQQLEPVSWLGLIGVLFSSIFALLNFYRGLMALSMSSLEDYDGPSPGHALCFVFESVLQCTQICLYVVFIQHRNRLSMAALVLLCLCNLYIWDLQELWFVLLNIAASTAMLIATLMRDFQSKPANYSV